MLGLSCAYGGLAQLCAGMWEVKRNNTFGRDCFHFVWNILDGVRASGHILCREDSGGNSADDTRYIFASLGDLYWIHGSRGNCTADRF